MQVVRSIPVTRQVVTHTFAKEKVSKFGTLVLSAHTVVFSISLVHERTAYVSSIEETSVIQIHCKVRLTLASQEILPDQTRLVPVKATNLESYDLPGRMQ